MSAPVPLVPIMVCILIGVGVTSLWVEGDPWGWTFVILGGIIGILHFRKLYKEED